MPFSRETLDRAGAIARGAPRVAVQADPLSGEMRLYEVAVLHGDVKLGLTVPALSVFGAATAAMSLLIMIETATADDFLFRRSRVLSVVEH